MILTEKEQYDLGGKVSAVCIIMSEVQQEIIGIREFNLRNGKVFQSDLDDLDNMFNIVIKAKDTTLRLREALRAVSGA